MARQGKRRPRDIKAESNIPATTLSVVLRIVEARRPRLHSLTLRLQPPAGDRHDDEDPGRGAARALHLDPRFARRRLRGSASR
jgi:hypothetical protein